MEIRRAILLFAIVLGLAALAASVSRPPDRRQQTPGSSATIPPAPASDARPAARLRFTAGSPRERRRLDPGRPAVVLVSADQPGQVELDGLGMNAPAEPLTPARFEVLADQPISVAVRFTPAGADAAQLVGTLDVSERESARSGGRSARPTERDR